MIYGNRFYGYNVINESKETKISKYKDVLDQSIQLLQIEYKWLELDSICFEKIYPIYMSINEKNAEDKYKEIKRIINQNYTQYKKVYDFDKFKEEQSKIHKKILSLRHFIFTEIPLLKNSEMNKIKTDFKNKLNKIQNDTKKYYNKYKDYIEDPDNNKISDSIFNKSEFIQEKVPDIFEEYDDIDDNIVWVILDYCRDMYRTIDYDLKFFNKNIIIYNGE